jgi:predicted PolB exonuclease-like 3'-5' exonuclease
MPCIAVSLKRVVPNLARIGRRLGLWYREKLMTSPHETVACLDIETVPDEEIMPEELPADTFPPVPCHRVVAISMVTAEIRRGEGGTEWFRATGVRSGGREDSDEAYLLRGFWGWIARAKPRIVTWNGRKFDLAVLKARSLIHGIPAAHWHTAGDKWSNYGKRYSSDWHCDLADVMTDYGASKMIGLDLMAKAIGFPGKIGGHGSEVAAMIREGRVDLVRNYCEGDVLNLFLLYVRWAALAGVSTPEGHNAGMRSLVEVLAGERDARPHLGDFLDAWRASTRPHPMMIPEPGQPRLDVDRLDPEDPPPGPRI